MLIFNGIKKKTGFIILLLIIIAGVFYFSNKTPQSVAQNSSSATPPVIFFSDLIDGPKTGWEGSATKGAAVTIWGKNLGTSRGSNYVTVGGVNLINDSDYAEWGVTANNARGLERITFWLNNECQSGSVNISVTIGGATTNTLPFYVRTTGIIYFVDIVNGSNSYNGLYSTYNGETNGSWLTPAYARQHIFGGDIVYIRTGTYVAADLKNAVICFTSAQNGSINNYTAFVGYPTEIPVFNETDPVTHGSGIANYGTGVGYVTVAKFKILPWTAAIDLSWSSVGYFRIVGIEVDGQDAYPPGTAMIGAIDHMDTSHVVIYGCHIHNWGHDQYDHGIYIGYETNGSTIHDFDIGWCEFNDLGDNVSGIFIHPKDSDVLLGYSDDINVHDSIFYNLEHAGIHTSSRNKTVRIWNNIIYNCGMAVGGGRPSVQFGAPETGVAYNVYFYNNTVYSTAGQSALYFLVKSNVTMKNNIIYSNGITYLSDESYSGVRSSDYDLWYGNGAPPSWATNALNIDPEFVNVASNDFRLQSASPAKDAGLASVGPFVLRDFNGNLRPQGSAYDIGAYEYLSDIVFTDTTPPTRSAGFPSGVLASGTTSVTLSLSTDENATCKYSATEGTNYDAMTGTFSTTGATAHSTAISDLQDGQTYNYYVKCIDTNNNTNSDDFIISFSVDSDFKTYYVATTGNDTTGNGSENNPWLTITYGIGKIASGDTLIIKDGTYTGTVNRIYDIPSGTSSQYTTIRAENDWGVTLSGTDNGTYASSIEINTNYIVARGFKIKNSGVSHVKVSGDYVKVIRCASDGTISGVGSSFVADGNYILFEECYAWGGNRYSMRTAKKSAQYVIFRRCVVRWDYSDHNEVYAAFANYDCPNVYFQNCIVIDGKDIRHTTYLYNGLNSFLTPNGADETGFDGCISLNVEGGGYYIDSSPVRKVVLNNCIAWDSKDEGQSSTETYKSWLFYSKADYLYGPLTLNHCTFGVCDLSEGLQIKYVPDGVIKNSIIYGVTLDAGNYALNGGSEDYNSFYNNTGGRNRSGGVGAHSITNINPKTNSLKYLPRIEANSDLSNKADDGGAIGANIIKKIGVSGTLYGEAGWNTLTNENLWPFPNEDVMKQDMAAFYKAPNEAYAGSPVMSGKRGFAADGNGLYGGPITLTSYIWEYLGNPCPPEICGYGVTPIPPNLTLTLQADKNEIQSGDVLIYTLTYQNTSSGAARNIVITDPIPQGTIYVLGSATVGGVYDAANSRITWTIPSLTDNASGAVSFQVMME